MQWRNQSHRPKPITVISILEFIPGIILVLFGVFMSFIVYMQIRMMSIFGGSPFSSFFGPIYILFLVMVIGYVALGILLTTCRPWTVPRKGMGMEIYGNT